MAKGMGNGFPIGGVLISPVIKASYGMLGTTFGGNHLACTAALAVLDIIENEHLIENAARIGEYFADCIRENNLEFNVLMGLAYHGIAFSTATACALFNKYGVTVDYCFDRKVADSKGRNLCGHTLKDGDKVVLVDDLMSTGLTICERIDRLKEQADIEVTALVVIADLTNEEARAKGLGTTMIEEKYGTKVYSIITAKDIERVIN